MAKTQLAADKVKLPQAIQLRLQFAKTNVNDRNSIAAERGYAVHSYQLTREVRYARITGTPSEKAIDYATQRIADNYGLRYSPRESRQLIDLGDRCKAVKNWGILRTWCVANGRNFMAAKQKSRRLLKKRRR